MSIFEGGIPWEIDIKKLVDRYGVPSADTLVTHSEVEACTGLTGKTSRYTAVLRGWRRRLFTQHNVDTIVDPGNGLKVLNPGERVEVSESGFKASIKDMRVSVLRAKVIPPDEITDPEMRKRRDHLEVVTSRIFMAAANEAKALRPAPPTQSSALPRPKAKNQAPG